MCDKGGVYTVGDWLAGCVNFAVPSDAIEYICANRDMSSGEPYNPELLEGGVLRLMKADLYKWIVLGAGKVNSTSDSDNGWSHSGGGYTLSEYDKRLLRDEANGIYDELEPESVFGKTKIRMRSAGIMPAYRDVDGCPLPRRSI